MPQQQLKVLAGTRKLPEHPAACWNKAQQQQLNLGLTRMRVASIWQARMGWLSWK